MNKAMIALAGFTLLVFTVTGCGAATTGTSQLDKCKDQRDQVITEIMEADTVKEIEAIGERYVDGGWGSVDGNILSECKDITLEQQDQLNKEMVDSGVESKLENHLFEVYLNDSESWNMEMEWSEV